MSENPDDGYQRKKPDWWTATATGPSGSATVDKATNLHSEETAFVVDTFFKIYAPQVRDSAKAIAIEEIKKSTVRFQEDLKKDVTTNMKKELDIDRRLTRIEEGMKFVKILYPLLFAVMVTIFVAIISNLMK